MANYYCEAYLGSPIDTVTIQEINDYFSVERGDEPMTIEYKSYYDRDTNFARKEEAVLKTICAFLNSNGGLLIWGAPIGTTNQQGEKVFTGELSPVEKRYTRDQFISKIANRILPYSTSVRFQDFEVEPGKYVYLFDVPESETKPHQFDDRYYMRLD